MRNKLLRLYLLLFFIAAFPLRALSSGGGADVGGGNIEELSFISYIFETANSLRTLDRLARSNNTSQNQIEEITKTYQTLQSALKKADNNNSLNVAELAGLLEKATNVCPVLIVPEEDFCDKAPRHLKLQAQSNDREGVFNCTRYSDRDFIGNKHGIIGRKEKWLNAELNRTSDALALATHEIVQNCLGLNDKKTSLSTIIGHISQKISESILILATPAKEHPSKVTLVGFKGNRDSYGSGVCKINSVEINSIEVNTDIQSLKTDFIFDLPSGERDLSNLSGTIPFNSLRDCNHFIASIRRQSEANLPIQFIFDRVYKNWKTLFIADQSYSFH